MTKPITKDIGNNLIINYLPQFLGDDEFKSMFLSIGPLRSCKIVRDKTTGFSYGFGFVEYDKDKDADRALKIFDGLSLHGKRIRVQHANKSDESSKGFNIYVKNIPSDYTETELDKLFETYGKITTSKVLVDLQTGQSRNVGFVLYETKAEADKAISELHGKLLPGASGTLILKYADDATKKQKSTPQTAVQHVVPQLQPYSQTFTSPPPSQGNGFTPPTPPGPMRNQSGSRFRFNPMSRDSSSNNYSNTMSNYGTGPGSSNYGAGPGSSNYGAGPGSSNYGAGPGAGMNQNYSNNQSQSNFGMGSMAGSMGSSSSGMNSGMSSPQLDIPTGQGPFSIFVFNIGDDAEERELWALFSPFGVVQKCTVMMDSDRKVSKGYGFVDMNNAMEAANAIKNLNGSFYKGRQLNVAFKSKRKDNQ